jgi:hypothetical protein
MATWKKLVVSGSDISQLTNDAGYISASQVPSAENSFATASFNGTDLISDSTSGTLNFASGSGGGLKIDANSATDTLTFDLEAVPNNRLANKDITIGTTTIDLGDSSTTLAGLTSVSSTTFTGELDSSSTLANGVRGVTQGPTDSSTLVATTEFVQNVVTQGDLDFSGDLGLNGSVDLDSQTFAITGGGVGGIETTSDANQGISISLVNDNASGGNIVPLNLSANGIGLDVNTITGQGLVAQTGQLTVLPETQNNPGFIPVTVTATGVSIDANLLADGSKGVEFDAANNTLAAVVDNQTIEINPSGELRIKDGGVDTDAIADSLGVLGTNEFTGSFTGSFTGDGSGLTGLATTLSTEGDSGTGTIDLQTQILDISGGSNITTTAGSQTIEVALNDSISVVDATVTGDLTVLGTASFQHESNLEVTDRFILLASGSSQEGDGGIIIQQSNQDVGDVFGFDGDPAGTKRWGIDQSQNASLSSFTPEAFMAAVLTGDADSDATIDALVDDRYEAKGNLFIGDDQDIWIWS